MVEGIVALGLFAIIGIGTLQIFSRLSQIVRSSSERVVAAALANEQFEIVRNLPYADVGIVSGIPVGKIERNQTLTRDGKQFLVVTTIRNVDDPFDGTIGGSPNDLSPADYKLVHLDITCISCRNKTPYQSTTTVAPKNLETASTNGALFVRVFDANGFAIPGATVHIENNAVDPAIVINEVTNANGDLQLVDVPPGNEVYEITVTKSGYSTEQTYIRGGIGNPNPAKPHASVVLQSVTQISFAIDRVSSINITTVNDTCNPVGDIDFDIQGAKLIGTLPDVPKYASSQATNGTGTLDLTDMEWDTYAFTLTDAGYYLAGAIPLVPVSVNPNTSQNLQMTVRPAAPNALLVTVEDAITKLPVPDANVSLEISGIPDAQITGRGYLRQTDWSGGDGQDQYIDQTRYFESDGNIDVITQPGEIRLAQALGVYSSAGSLTSSTFDTGSESNFHNIVWQPQSQQVETGENSVKFQVATNNDNATWNFLGPDGTDATYYTLSETTINAVHNSNRYFRYKVFLTTEDPSITPIVSDISFTFTSSCVPSGQVLYDGKSTGTYNLTVSKTGYQTFTSPVDITTGWQQTIVTLQPE